MRFNRAFLGFECATVLAATLILGPSARSQQFINAAANIPPLGGATEAVKFGDFDLDGDLDLVYANGGDAGNQQSRLLVNNGLAQGGVIGTFSDATATKLLPNFAQTSRDVQVVDLDNDGDLDLHFSNDASGGIQSATWFVNQGGAQGGIAGAFGLDMSRWVGIGVVGLSGSSIPAGQTISTGNFAGGFQDWSGQAEFADVDLDGDMDLLHSSYGSGTSGHVMSRMFLNGRREPLGTFREYNPSGAVSPNPNLDMGNPAGFVEGTQRDNTLDVMGAEHDITNMSFDVDLADMDGDFDNDIYGNSLYSRQRFYQNRYFENGGGLGSESSGSRLYRDVTASWGVVLTDATNNYDGELADMDNDDDVDGYFLNGGLDTTDVWLTNDGTGVLGGLHNVPNSNNDDNETDFHDYDNDGDVDPIICAFRGADKFYKNQFVETSSINLVQVFIAAGGGADSLAADVGDMDNDGDTDLIFAEDANVNEALLRNTLNVSDPIAPRVPRMTQLVSAGPSAQPRVVTTQVFDNAGLEYFRTATATFAYAVNGSLKQAPANWAGGNLFRATIPGYWTGSISYAMTVTDRAGNLGSSPSLSVAISSAGLSTYGAGTPGCSGAHAIGANSAPTVPNPDFALTCTNAPPSSLGLAIVGDAQSLGSDPLGLGVTLLVDVFSSSLLAGFNFTSDPSGNGLAPIPIPDAPAILGATIYGQAIWSWTAGPCSPSPFGLSTSSGLAITFLP